MNTEELIVKLKNEGYEDLLELIEDAKNEQLTELEIVESIGLVYDRELNEVMLSTLRDLGVEIIYVTDDE